MGLPLQVLKHFKFTLFFNVEPNPSTKLMAHVGSNSSQKNFNSIPKSIRVGIIACSHSSINSKRIKSYGTKPLDFLKLPIKKKPKIFYDKTCVF
jgi:hypothetical protein